MNLKSHILTLIEKHAEKPFLIDALSNRQYLYGETNHIVMNLAQALSVRGLGRGQRIAILLKNSPECAFLYLACLYSGIVAVPISPALQEREIGFILKNAGVRLLVYSPATQGLFKPSGIKQEGIKLWCLIPLNEEDQPHNDQDDCWSLSTSTTSCSDGLEPLDKLSPQNLFSITFTSGTTDRPKGVPHSVDSLLRSALAFNEELGFRSDNRFLHILPMSYMAGFLNSLLCPFLVGASVILVQPPGAREMLRFWEPVIRYGADTFWVTPSLCAALLVIDRDLAGPKYCRRHTTTFCVGTAPLPIKVKKDFEKKYGVELFESYGLSELLFVSTNSCRFPRIDGSVGRLLQGVEIQVVSEEHETLPPGKDGEIRIRTPYMMVGYLNYLTSQPEALDHMQWFPTGDIGHISEEGHLFITGRKKDLIIRSGINISPRVIEDSLLNHDAIEEAAVIGLPHDLYGEEVIAFVKLKPGHHLEMELASLESHCRQYLSAHSVPARFIPVSDFPTTLSGKVLKTKLREQLLAGARDSL